MYVDPRFLQRPPSFTQAQIGRALLLGDRTLADRMRQANMLANQPQTIKLKDGRIIHYLPNDPTQQWQEAAPVKIETLKPGEYTQGTRPNAAGGFDIAEGSAGSQPGQPASSNGQPSPEAGTTASSQWSASHLCGEPGNCG
jgi:hypothetical protein